jgi:hypothetical protein
MDEFLEGAVGRLITRGNLDGIACAAIFLQSNPRGKVSFVTSPPAALREIQTDRSPRALIADLPLTAELVEAMDARKGEVRLVDHHPTVLRSEHATIDLERSAAGALHAFLGHHPSLCNIAALADHHERSGTSLAATIAGPGLAKLEHEASVLDFAWRFNVEDDAFRCNAARSLSQGLWPSQVPSIIERYSAVREQGRWKRALEKVGSCLDVRGDVGLLDLRGRRESLHGFGTVALGEAARARGCGYTLLLHGSKGTATASLRSSRRDGLDLGRFAEGFTKENGVDGGGHRSSAGARVPMAAADRLIDQLVSATC